MAPPLKKEEEKKKYLVITRWWWVRKATARDTEFSNTKDYPRKMIYEGDNYKIYDHNKTSALPLVSMLMEDFDLRDNRVMVVIILCGITLLWIWWLFYSYSSSSKKIDNISMKINTLWWKINQQVQQATEEQKNTQKTVLEEVVANKWGKGVDEGTNIPSKEEKKTELENKIIFLEQNNRALELEKEKYKMLANNKEPDRLAIYEAIKKEFYEVEKDRLRKEVELEYITGSGGLADEEKKRIRKEVEEEIKKEYKTACTSKLAQEYKDLIEVELIKKYKELLSKKCKND